MYTTSLIIRRLLGRANDLLSLSRNTNLSVAMLATASALPTYSCIITPNKSLITSKKPDRPCVISTNPSFVCPQGRSRTQSAPLSALDSCSYCLANLVSRKQLSPFHLSCACSSLNTKICTRCSVAQSGGIPVCSAPSLSDDFKHDQELLHTSQK
jgi:hypothetical protein